VRQRWRVVWTIALLWGVTTAAVARAHHPTPASHPGAEGAWPLLLLLGACVFIVVFAATWAVFSFFERRQQLRSGEREPSRRLS
jgi:heme/copper-type cytochrome/quinol oxidase subunit 2